MKHLKTYTLYERISKETIVFENFLQFSNVVTDEIWDNISDILLELKDEGFNVSKHHRDFKKVSNKLCEDVIEIVVNKKSISDIATEDINYEEVKDTFMRLIDYLTPYHFSYSILYFGDFSFIEFECGGEDPLAKLDGRNIERKPLGNDIFNPKYSEELKIPKECHAFKICFYQKVDHIIT